MELVRRIALMAGVVLGFWLGMSAGPEPLVAVRNLDPAREQQYLGGSFLTAEEQRLRSLPLDQFLRTLLAQAAEVRDQACTDFLAAAARASAAGGGSQSHRLGPDALIGDPFIFFRTSELPAGCLAGVMQDAGQGGRALAVTHDAALPVAEVRVYPTTADQFQLGSGYQRYPAPPSNLLHPLRPWSLACLGAGLALYALLPRRKRLPDEVGYARSRVIAGDVVGLMLLALFFGLPLLVPGSSQAALGTGLFLILPCWPLAGLGGLILYLCATHASHGMVLAPDGLTIFKLWGGRSIAFSAMRRVQVVEKRPPAWLRWGLSLAAAASGSPAAAGMAMLQSASAPFMLCIEVNAGPPERIWLTDQSGSPILRNLDALLDRLRQARVPGADALLR